MIKLSVTTVSLLLGLLSLNSLQASQKEWSYEGKTGPAYWGELSPDNVMCRMGKNQSPININSQQTADFDQEPIKLNYSMLVADRIRNTGHSIQVDMRSGGVMQLDGQEFELKQFHFHTPSENTVNGKHFPIEAHFVHANDEGELAVLGMMFVPGKADATLTALWQNMPKEAGDSVRLPSGALKSIESESSFSNYYRFNGSLTTPPCSEGVRWVIMQSPMTVSEAQVNALQVALKHENNRPVQSLNARLVLE